MFKSIFSKYQIDSIIKLVNGSKNYYIYEGFATQTGTSAPVITIIDNTLGSIVWTRDGSGGKLGSYLGTLTGAFIANKTFLENPKGGFVLLNPSNTEVLGSYYLYRQSNNVVVLQSYDALGVAADVILNNAPIKIKVYK